MEMTKWIKCSEDLPKHNKPVLIFANEEIIIDRKSDPKDGNIWACTYLPCVTHWAELPKPPDKNEIDRIVITGQIYD
jgi:hypothetical protein